MRISSRRKVYTAGCWSRWGTWWGKTKLFAKGISWERLEPGNLVRTKGNNADLEGVTMDCVVQVVVWVQGTLNKVSYKENPVTGWKKPCVGANRELDICGGSDTASLFH